MRGFLAILAVALMSLPGQLAFAAPEDAAATGEQTGNELSVDELKVNINTDDASALAAGLNGVGMKRALAIVQHREANGPFQTASDLANVKGIGVRTVLANSDRIEVD